MAACVIKRGMGELLTDMDPAYRAALAIFIAVIIKAWILAKWDNFKERKAAEPIPMKLHKGVYRPWGAVQKIQRAINIWVMIWAACMIAMLAALAYTRLF